MDDIIRKLTSFNIKFSISEENGINQLTDEDKVVFCPGVSTCGVAEMRMALDNKDRKIIATTIDKDGFKKTKQVISKSGLSSQIDIRLEDMRDEFQYGDGYFDFIYSRLVLHYLSNDELKKVLEGFYRILKKNGKLFIVVRSDDDWEANLEGKTYDEKTGMTTYPLFDTEMKDAGETRTRNFHSKEGLCNFLTKAGFKISYAKKYKEQLFHDYLRTIKTPKLGSVIEIMAIK